MGNTKVKFLIDILILLLSLLTFVVAADDLLINETPLYALRGCFLYDAAFFSEGLAYYVTTGGLYKKKLTIHTGIFVMEFISIILIFSLFITSAHIGIAWYIVIILTMIVYPIKQLVICIIDLRHLLHIYG